jgi:Sigma-70 factor, region 1.1/Protein of unknown function (DUF551)
MAGWKPIATAPRETGRPLLLYPFPFPRGSAEKMEAMQPHDGPLLDLSDAAVRRMIKFAKRRGYVTVDELDQVLPPEEFSVEQIEDVIHQLAQMGINVVESEETQEKAQPRATTERKEPPEGQPEAPASDVSLSEASWVVYGNVFEGYWDGARWLSAGGVPCEPTHWMPLPSPPLVLVRR